MRSLLYVAALALVAIVATWAYQVIDDTQKLLDEVDALHADIVREREAISVLNAEWAWLNRPERLDGLVRAHETELALAPLTPSHFADVAAVAFQPPPPHAPGAAPEPTAPPAPALVAGALGLTAPAPVAAPPAPMAPVPAMAEAPVSLAGLVGIDRISLGLPLPPPRPARR